MQILYVHGKGEPLRKFCIIIFFFFLMRILGR